MAALVGAVKSSDSMHVAHLSQASQNSLLKAWGHARLPLTSREEKMIQRTLVTEEL